MVVITLTRCPDSLRGDLTKWLLEVDIGVFVGRLNARVRDQVWERLCKALKSGRATMAYSASNEQRLEFRVANSTWTPVDFEGLTLIRRPVQAGEAGDAGGNAVRPGFSNAARRMRARKMARRGSGSVKNVETRSAYIVVDVETTGLAPGVDRIIEVSALRVRDGTVMETFSVLVRQTCGIPPKVAALTGLTDAILREAGQEEAAVLDGLLAFIGADTLVAHNAGFDVGFINAACRRAGRLEITNTVEDTLVMAKRRVKADSYRLRDLARDLEIDGEEVDEGANRNDKENALENEAHTQSRDRPLTGGTEKQKKYHRSLTDCKLTKKLYEKLIKMK